MFEISWGAIPTCNDKGSKWRACQIALTSQETASVFPARAQASRGLARGGSSAVSPDLGETGSSTSLSAPLKMDDHEVWHNVKVPGGLGCFSTHVHGESMGFVPMHLLMWKMTGRRVWRNEREGKKQGTTFIYSYLFSNCENPSLDQVIKVKV